MKGIASFASFVLGLIALVAFILCVGAVANWSINYLAPIEPVIATIPEPVPVEEIAKLVEIPPAKPEPVKPLKIEGGKIPEGCGVVIIHVTENGEVGFVLPAGDYTAGTFWPHLRTSVEGTITVPDGDIQRYELAPPDREAAR